jgi:hypothetical protein
VHLDFSLFVGNLRPPDRTAAHAATLSRLLAFY